MIFNKEQVMAYLPHRDPFLFVDSVSHIEVVEDKPIDIITTADLVGGKVVAHFYTREDHPIFAGHFPGNPILPGVVQIESMAQASSFIMTKIVQDPFNCNMDVALVSVSNAKFRKAIVPGMDLELRSILKKIRGPMISQDCQIYHEGQLMSEASVLASIKF
ncbi:MAG: hypothetical protein OEY33_00085 [Bdellovibrionales bacterium]|jgi:3-hydroxyacyl-[acyl-carrier-protein] dehydratase|nr:hypothetical protein [Bdellovibrionales bacterium]